MKRPLTIITNIVFAKQLSIESEESDELDDLEDLEDSDELEESELVESDVSEGSEESEDLVTLFRSRSKAFRWLSMSPKSINPISSPKL